MRTRFIATLCALLTVSFFCNTTFAAEEEPTGQSAKATDVFGRKGGYFHPYLSISENYNDNVYNTNTNTISDSLTVISPGIWLAVPGTKEPLLNLSTSTATPGGIALSRDKTEYFKRYQLYLLYGADIIRYQDETSEDTEDHRAEAFFQYNLKGGLSIDLIDQYMKNHDSRGTGVSTELDMYDTNLANTAVSYDVSEKFRLRADLSRYTVDYDASRNRARDRDDTSASAYVFYKFMPRTSVFVEYEHIGVDYDINTLSDSTEQHIYSGLKWDVSQKTRGKFKAGYLHKNFDRTGIKDKDDLTLELQGDYTFSPKTSVMVTGTRRINETTIQTSNYTLAHSVSLTYAQKFTKKISANLGFTFTNDEYDGTLTVGAQTGVRTDDIYSIAPALQYAIMDWLTADLSYIYGERDSNFNAYDYENNTVFLRFTAGI